MEEANRNMTDRGSRQRYEEPGSSKAKNIDHRFTYERKNMHPMLSRAGQSDKSTKLAKGNRASPRPIPHSWDQETTGDMDRGKNPPENKEGNVAKRRNRQNRNRRNPEMGNKRQQTEAQDLQQPWWREGNDPQKRPEQRRWAEKDYPIFRQEKMTEIDQKGWQPKESEQIKELQKQVKILQDKIRPLETSEETAHKNWVRNSITQGEYIRLT